MNCYFCNSLMSTNKNRFKCTFCDVFFTENCFTTCKIVKISNGEFHVYWHFNTNILNIYKMIANNNIIDLKFITTLPSNNITPKNIDLKLPIILTFL